MEISIGAEVMGASGRLGEIDGAIIDARTDQVTDLVIKHGFLFGRERVVPLPHVQRVADGAVYLDLDEQGLEAMDGYAEMRRGPNPDYVGTPDADLQGTHRGNLALDQFVAAGGGAGLGAGAKPLGYPGGEQLTPDLMQRPAIKTGMAVLDAQGEKVGDLDAFCFDHETGRPTRMIMKRGLIFKRETELPLEWLRDLGDDGVLLAVPRGQVEALAAAQKDEE